MNISHLEWDSKFFKLKVGKVELDTLNAKQYSTLLQEKEESQYDILYLFVANLPNIEERENLFLADKKVIYHKRIDPSSTNDSNSHIENYTGQLREDLIDLALASGHKSRFIKDKRLIPQFKKLYTTWLEKSLDGSMADEVFIHQTKNKINGFVTVKNKQRTGVIGLIAVDEKERGKGIGKGLILEAEQWYQSQGICECEVVTQLDNIGACRLYEQLGYTIKNIQYIYHI